MELFDVYPLYDVAITRGLGCTVWDDKGTEYLDLYGGHAVISVGHSHPRYVEAITRQVSQLGFYSNSVVNPLQQQLAKRLGEVSGYEDYSLFLVNSGAEANENALKLASFHTGRKRVVAVSKAFHGRTSLAVSVTDNPRIVAPVNQTPNVTFVPFNDIDAATAELRKGDVAALIVEGIQGVGGIIVPANEYLQALRDVCTETGTVLILDEIQSGYGRTGQFFAHQYTGVGCAGERGVRPDIITVAKGIANGFPCGGVLISPMFTAAHGMLGTTFGGNHLACAAALSVLDIIEDEKLIENAARVGEYIIERLQGIAGVREVRGRGLMIGIDFEQPVKELRTRLIYEDHIFTGAAGTHTIRLLPPLCLTVAQADVFIEALKK